MATATRLVVLIILVEYIARRFVRYLFPQVGALLVNDMLVLALAYGLLVSGVIWKDCRLRRDDLGSLVHEVRCFPRDRLYWYSWAALGVGSLLALPVDRWLALHVTLPQLESPVRNETLWFAEWARFLGAASLLLVNGVWVPIAEEFLWRGCVQLRLQENLPLGAAIVLSAILFSIKHAIVDASLGRLLFITTFGVILGFVAARRRWEAAAVFHASVNLVATALVITTGLLAP